MDILQALKGSKFDKKVERNFCGLQVTGKQENGLPLLLYTSNQGEMFLEVTIYDEDLDDGRELTFQLTEIK